MNSYRLAVPPMHRDISRADRIKVMEYVLRRQFGLAWDMACDLEETRLHRLGKGTDPSIGALINVQFGAISHEGRAA